MKKEVKLIAISKPVVPELDTAEELIAYCARVSNQKNQLNNKTAPKLIKYCADHGHWSIFETVFITMEIQCTRDIGRQILRHRSFSFQEFSQRYSEVLEGSFTNRECRLQDNKNRQNSLEIDVKNNDNLDMINQWKKYQESVIDESLSAYQWAIENGIAKEQARSLLPEGLTMSRMYMTGSLRSWIHYCKVRCSVETQKEHREVADLCKEIILTEFPSISSIF